MVGSPSLDPPLRDSEYAEKPSQANFSVTCLNHLSTLRLGERCRDTSDIATRHADKADCYAGPVCLDDVVSHTSVCLQPVGMKKAPLDSEA